VIGMTPELLARLRPHLTVFTDSDPSASTLDLVVAKALAAVGQRNVNIDEIGAGLVSVTVDARGPGFSRFDLHVIVRVNAQPEGRRYEILSRERLGRDNVDAQCGFHRNRQRDAPLAPSG
jgi:general secretion pathway protein K